MKSTTILLLVLALGLLVTGCSKTIPAAQVNSDTADTAVATDITIDTAVDNPDIGTLDDTPVSDELPQ